MPEIHSVRKPIRKPKKEERYKLKSKINKADYTDFVSDLHSIYEKKKYLYKTAMEHYNYELNDIGFLKFLLEKQPSVARRLLAKNPKYKEIVRNILSLEKLKIKAKDNKKHPPIKKVKTEVRKPIKTTLEEKSNLIEDVKLGANATFKDAKKITERTLLLGKNIKNKVRERLNKRKKTQHKKNELLEDLKVGVKATFEDIKNLISKIKFKKDREDLEAILELIEEKIESEELSAKEIEIINERLEDAKKEIKEKKYNIARNIFSKIKNYVYEKSLNFYREYKEGKDIKETQKLFYELKNHVIDSDMYITTEEEKHKREELLNKLEEIENNPNVDEEFEKKVYDEIADFLSKIYQKTTKEKKKLNLDEESKKYQQIEHLETKDATTLGEKYNLPILNKKIETLINKLPKKEKKRYEKIYEKITTMPEKQAIKYFEILEKKINKIIQSKKPKGLLTYEPDFELPIDKEAIEKKAEEKKDFELPIDEKELEIEVAKHKGLLREIKRLPENFRKEYLTKAESLINKLITNFDREQSYLFLNALQKDINEAMKESPDEVLKVLDIANKTIDTEIKLINKKEELAITLQKLEKKYPKNKLVQEMIKELKNTKLTELDNFSKKLEQNISKLIDANSKKWELFKELRKTLSKLPVEEQKKAMQEIKTQLNPLIKNRDTISLTKTLKEALKKYSKLANIEKRLKKAYTNLDKLKEFELLNFTEIESKIKKYISGKRDYVEIEEFLKKLEQIEAKEKLIANKIKNKKINTKNVFKLLEDTNSLKHIIELLKFISKDPKIVSFIEQSKDQAKIRLAIEFFELNSKLKELYNIVKKRKLGKELEKIVLKKMPIEERLEVLEKENRDEFLKEIYDLDFEHKAKLFIDGKYQKNIIDSINNPNDLISLLSRLKNYDKSDKEIKLILSKLSKNKLDSSNILDLNKLKIALPKEYWKKIDKIIKKEAKEIIGKKEKDLDAMLKKVKNKAELFKLLEEKLKEGFTEKEVKEELEYIKKQLKNMRIETQLDKLRESIKDYDFYFKFKEIEKEQVIIDKINKAYHLFKTDKEQRYPIIEQALKNITENNTRKIFSEVYKKLKKVDPEIGFNLAIELFSEITKRQKLLPYKEKKALTYEKSKEEKAQEINKRLKKHIATKKQITEKLKELDDLLDKVEGIEDKKATLKAIRSTIKRFLNEGKIDSVIAFLDSLKEHILNNYIPNKTSTKEKKIQKKETKEKIEITEKEIKEELKNLEEMLKDKVKDINLNKTEEDEYYYLLSLLTKIKNNIKNIDPNIIKKLTLKINEFLKEVDKKKYSVAKRLPSKVEKEYIRKANRLIDILYDLGITEEDERLKNIFNIVHEYLKNKDYDLALKTLDNEIKHYSDIEKKQNKTITKKINEDKITIEELKDAFKYEILKPKILGKIYVECINKKEYLDNFRDRPDIVEGLLNALEKNPLGLELIIEDVFYNDIKINTKNLKERVRKIFNIKLEKKITEEILRLKDYLGDLAFYDLITKSYLDLKIKEIEEKEEHTLDDWFNLKRSRIEAAEKLVEYEKQHILKNLINDFIEVVFEKYDKEYIFRAIRNNAKMRDLIKIINNFAYRKMYDYALRVVEMLPKDEEKWKYYYAIAEHNPSLVYKHILGKFKEEINENDINKSYTIYQRLSDEEKEKLIGKAKDYEEYKHLLLEKYSEEYRQKLIDENKNIGAFTYKGKIDEDTIYDILKNEDIDENNFKELAKQLSLSYLEKLYREVDTHKASLLEDIVIDKELEVLDKNNKKIKEIDTKNKKTNEKEINELLEVYKEIAGILREVNENYARNYDKLKVIIEKNKREDYKKAKTNIENPINAMLEELLEKNLLKYTKIRHNKTLRKYVEKWAEKKKNQLINEFETKYNILTQINTNFARSFKEYFEKEKYTKSSNLEQLSLLKKYNEKVFDKAVKRYIELYLKKGLPLDKLIQKFKKLGLEEYISKIEETKKTVRFTPEEFVKKALDNFLKKRDLDGLWDFVAKQKLNNKQKQIIKERLIKELKEIKNEEEKDTIEGILTDLDKDKN